MFSLLSSIGNPNQKPVTNVGFPFKYYYQFWLNKSDSPNCGWVFKYFIFDFIICWIVVLLIYFNKKNARN